jgi:glyoxylase-like metal-dependent hydrolase (beta-lactamase superfamily II)
LNTHWHFDHAGSNDYFGHTGSVIIAHDNVRKMLASGAYLSVVDREVPPAPAEALPVITFNDSLSLHLNGEEVHMLHMTPGHTDGDSIIWFKDSNIIHMGDTFLVERKLNSTVSLAARFLSEIKASQKRVGFSSAGSSRRYRCGAIVGTIVDVTPS